MTHMSKTLVDHCSGRLALPSSWRPELSKLALAAVRVWGQVTFMPWLKRVLRFGPLCVFSDGQGRIYLRWSTGRVRRLV